VNLDFVSAYILYRDGEAAIVDTGVGGSEAAIEAALAEIGLSWDSVGHVIVTHKHPDHQGSVQAVLAATEAPWYAGAGDIAEIEAPREGTVIETVDMVFDLRIIPTPGHTPGHISVLDDAAGILVAGDALSGEDGVVAGPNPDFSEDMDAAMASVFILAGLEFETILFGHGEPILENGRDAVNDFAFG
jgi:glyoxylase-like metal-dependent hydrolase (beta-lactamase superfamily II)